MSDTTYWIVVCDEYKSQPYYNLESAEQIKVDIEKAGCCDLDHMVVKVEAEK